MNLITQTDLAKQFDPPLSRQAVNDAVKRGLLNKLSDGKIDLDDPLTQDYISNNSHQRVSYGEKKNGDWSNDIGEDRAELERQKVAAMVQKINIGNAQALGDLVLREKVSRLFGSLSGSIVNHFHPLGDRLSVKICGELEINEQEKILAVKKILEDEIMRALEAFKSEAARDV